MDSIYFQVYVPFYKLPKQNLILKFSLQLFTLPVYLIKRRKKTNRKRKNGRVQTVEISINLHSLPAFISFLFGYFKSHLFLLHPKKNHLFILPIHTSSTLLSEDTLKFIDSPLLIFFYFAYIIF